MIGKIVKRGGVIALIFPLAGNRLAVILYRLSNFLYKIRIPEIPYVLQYINAVINGCEIHYKAKIGKKFKISHSRGIVIGYDVEIGNNVTVHSGVVMGKNGPKTGMPKIGDGVFIGAGVVIVGGIEIGEKTVIGANSFINKSVESNKLIGGVPFKILKSLTDD